MKRNKLLLSVILISSLLFLGSCGPIIITPDSHVPTPSLLYPNRIEPVRYVYFPEHIIYYDLSARQYLYLESSVWIRVDVLPPRYRSMDLNRSKFVGVKGHNSSSNIPQGKLF
ncbi:hypothetical protein H2O64_14525 [Kordia sp. YSTF-M3]|uniref:Lipoprotein n=1 Tax=Kordia aestuariivivens TaxID=2759037 RepID=A0ABR7QBE3_9FLAO|nr:hypothetical protein [Kordia aestuariivivens]MBC8755890.1 hypothetical protein [Kordia aestuariivivens]